MEKFPGLVKMEERNLANLNPLKSNKENPGFLKPKCLNGNCLGKLVPKNGKGSKKEEFGPKKIKPRKF